MSRRVLAAGILAVWLTVLGWHVRREYFAPLGTRLLKRARALAPGTFFYTVRMNGHAIGFSFTQMDTLSTGFVLRDRVLLDIPALGETHRALVQSEIFLDPILQLQSFRFELGSEIGAFKVSGVRQDSVLALQLTTGSNAQKSTLSIDPSVLLDAALPMRIAAGGQLEVGQAMQATVFNPSTMAAQRLELRVTARDTLIVTDSARYDAARRQWLASSADTIPVWRLEQKLSGITVSSWVDEDGHLVKAESPLGYTLERTAFELADQDWKRSLADGSLTRSYGAVIERTAIAANVDLANVAARDSLRVRMSGIDLRGFDLAGGRQQLRADTLFIKREASALLRATFALPYRGTGEPAGELGSTPLIQVQHPEIVRTARQIADGSSDPVRVAERLNEWVYRQLAKNVTLSVPSAEQVLRARQGDCNEHTVLYVALARALGLPARTAVGLVHVRGRFYYHAWPEVWLADRWVAVDPTLGQFPADATHLRFITGELARQIELIRLIGRLQLEVV